jgi:hypothetical protein
MKIIAAKRVTRARYNKANDAFCVRDRRDAGVLKMSLTLTHQEN